MSRNGSGTYNLPAGNPVVTGTTITTTWANTTLNDIASALTGSVASDGQTPMSSSLNMATNKIINVTDPTNAQDAATKAYVDAATGGISSTYLAKANNLSDVASASTSRTNLGLGTIATQAASSVAITGGAIDGTTVGSTTPSSVKASSLTVTGSTSGTLALAATAVAGTNTATFPAATGTVMVSGNMPAFSAYLSSNQSITNATWTKVQFSSEEFDTASCFNTSTYRFTPTVAGYYQVNLVVNCSYGAGGTTQKNNVISVYKNGSSFKQSYMQTDGTSLYGSPTTSAIIYLNGSTDYIEAYVYISGGSVPIVVGDAGGTYTYFSACLVRTA